MTLTSPRRKLASRALSGNPFHPMGALPVKSTSPCRQLQTVTAVPFTRAELYRTGVRLHGQSPHETYIAPTKVRPPSTTRRPLSLHRLLALIRAARLVDQLLIHWLEYYRSIIEIKWDQLLIRRV